jgi:transcriptional regulator with XRE-family HTH domain
MTNNIRFEDWLHEQMQNPGFRSAMKELEPAYQVARLRIKQGLTQKELAKLVGTRQSSISRLESGKSQPSLSFLRRVIEALGGQLTIQISEAPTSLSCILPRSTADSDETRGIVVYNWPQAAPSTRWSTQSSSTSR